MQACLDSLAMGIPVLTCPNNLYAGAISAALIEQAGYGHWIAKKASDLPELAKLLSNEFKTANSRRSLAAKIRNSLVCNTKQIPEIFSDEIEAILRQSRL